MAIEKYLKNYKSVGCVFGGIANYSKSEHAEKRYLLGKNIIFRIFPKDTHGDYCKEVVYKIWTSYDRWKVL